MSIKNTITPFLIFLNLITCAAQVDTAAVRLRLERIGELDQKGRKQIQAASEKYGPTSGEVWKLWKEQEAHDSANLHEVQKIIHAIGAYPGRSLVGSPASEVSFYVLQHAPDSVQAVYLDMILQAARDNELKRSLAALYHDRYLMHQGEPQIYGTQIRTLFLTDSTGAKRDSSFLWPVADTTAIDSLRYTQGLSPLEDYLQRFGLSRWD